MSERIERLRELLEEPLLITNEVNVLYLTGFDSSNAALLVEPDRARLFTDFRRHSSRSSTSDRCTSTIGIVSGSSAS